MLVYVQRSRLTEQASCTLIVGRESRGSKWCLCWQSKGTRYFTVRRPILILGPSETRRSSFFNGFTVNQVVHHFGNVSVFGM